MVFIKYREKGAEFGLSAGPSQGQQCFLKLLYSDAVTTLKGKEEDQKTGKNRKQVIIY